MQRATATNGCNDRMPQKICQCPQGIAHDGCRRYYLRSEETHKKFRLDLPIWAHAWNRCYKFGKLLEQMLQVRRHSLLTTLPCVESTVEHQKMLRARQFFNIFTFKCAFRHSGVQSYKFGKLLEQMLQVRRHSLLTTLPCVEATVEHQKMLRARQFFNIFTFKCAFRHSGVQSTVEHQKMLRARQLSNVHFAIEMCISPQRRTDRSRASKNAASTTVF